MNQYVAMLYKKSINMCMPLHNKIQCVGILHKENQYVEAPPQKEFVCGGPSMKRNPYVGDPSQTGNNVYIYIYMEAPPQGINVWQSSTKGSQYV